MSPTPPFFVVGSKRSGTTLLRLMLDSHPRLAVPDESGFIVQGPGSREPVDAALERILAHYRFKLWEVPEAEVRAEVARRNISSYAELVDCVFSLYMRRHGKARWGDKTPQYAFYIPQLLRLFPDAQFVHMIRDGRESAASIYDYRMTDSVISAADHWRRSVRSAQRAARLGPERYHEVRLADLIARPRETLEVLCSFLGERYDPQMLEYHRNARARLPRFCLGYHRHTVTPPTRHLRDWRDGLSHREQDTVEAVCARTLRRLGMDAPSPPWRGYVIAAVHILRTRRAELTHPHYRPEFLPERGPADTAGALRMPRMGS